MQPHTSCKSDMKHCKSSKVCGMGLTVSRSTIAELVRVNDGQYRRHPRLSAHNLPGVSSVYRVLEMRMISVFKAQLVYRAANK